MRKTTQARIATHFAALTDPRRGKVTYPLINVVTLPLCGMLCGTDDFVSIAEWGQQKRDWLAKRRPWQRHGPGVRPWPR